MLAVVLLWFAITLATLGILVLAATGRGIY